MLNGPVLPKYLKLENLTIIVKICFSVTTITWICFGIFLLFHRVTILFQLSPVLIVFSSIYCLLYLFLGFYTNDYGESGSSYKERLKNTGIIDDV